MSSKKLKVGIFGGMFNPPHKGHLQSLQTIQTRIGLDEILVIPAYQNPLKQQVEGPEPVDRLRMVENAVKTLGPQFKVDDRELKREGKSFTIDTLKDLAKERPNDEFYLIVGADHWQTFPEWKSWKKILELANLVVTSRPGYNLPTAESDAVKFLSELVEIQEFNTIELKTGKSIQFVSIEEVPISSTELRRSFMKGQKSPQYVPLSVENYIDENNLYKRIRNNKVGEKILTEFAAQVLFSRKAIQVRGFDLRKRNAITEYALVASGTSTRHTSALAENVLRSIKDEFGIFPIAIDGMSEGRWVVLDFGTLIVHLFYDYVRSEYALEALWNGAIEIKLIDEALPKP